MLGMERWSDPFLPLWVAVSEDVSCRSSFDASMTSASAFNVSSWGPVLGLGVLPCRRGAVDGERIGGRGGIVFSVGLLGWELLLPSPSLERIGMFESDIRFF